MKIAFSILGKQLSTASMCFPKPIHHSLPRTFWTSEFLTFSPCHNVRPNSRSSLGSSRLSSSHNSLSVLTAHRADDSSFITQAVSHDTLTSNQISDLYNVPFDSDVYAIPVDTLKPPVKPKRNVHAKKRRRNTSSGCQEFETQQLKQSISRNTPKSSHTCLNIEGCIGKRHSMAGSSTHVDTEPVHMTLHEVRQYLQALYSSSSDSSDHKDVELKTHNPIIIRSNIRGRPETDVSSKPILTINQRCKKNLVFNIRNKKTKDTCDNSSEY